MIYRVLIFILLFVVGANAQIRRLVIDDFSGGINQAAPSKVQPNQCYDMINFDITPDGALTPRRGFDTVSLASDSLSGRSIQALIPYNEIGNKYLIIQRTGWLNYAQIVTNGTQGGPDTLRDTVTVGVTDYAIIIVSSTVDPGYLHGLMVDSINAHPTLSTFVTAYDSSDGTSAGDGVFVILNAGYEDSTLSIRGSRVVGLQQIINWQWLSSRTMNYTKIRSGTEDSILSQFNSLIYSGRAQTGTPSFYYNGNIYLASQGSEMQFFNGDTMAFARTLCDSQLTAVAIDNSGSDSTLTSRMVRYSHANLTASFPVEVFDGVVYLSNINYPPVPIGGLGAAIFRSIGSGSFEKVGNALFGDFIDSLPKNSADSTNIATPVAYCFDSVISFKPSQIMQRGSQAFAIGNPEHPNRIYFSAFYEATDSSGPTTWVADKFWDIPSDQGDWFVRLAVLGDAIYAFRQNSIVRISGFTFYQYQIQQFSSNVGAYAPQSVAATLSHIYFVGYDGVYVTNGGPPIKISHQIQHVWDLNFGSVQNYIGRTIKDEYWLTTQTALSNNDDDVYAGGTYIFDEKNGSWRRSDIYYTDIESYNTDTTELDYREPQIVIVREDELYRQDVSAFRHSLDIWDSTESAGVYGTNAEYTYWSRELFEGSSREKIHYLDIIGRGEIDSLHVISFRENLTNLGTNKILDSIQWGGIDFYVSGEVHSDTAFSVLTRVRIDKIVSSYQFKLKIYPNVRTDVRSLFSSSFTITSIVVGWQPWDEGRPR